MSPAKKGPAATQPNASQKTAIVSTSAAPAKDANSPAATALLRGTSTAVLPGGMNKQEEDGAAKKQEAMDAAVKRFKDISTSLGGHEQAKAFFATYGTDGFKPEQEKEKELISAKELSLDSEIKDYSGKKLEMPARPENYGAKYLEESWEIEEPTSVEIATALKAEDWQHLIDTTKMLHGYVMSNSKGLSRARFQAFQLKPPQGKSYTDNSVLTPDYEVFDSSSISIKETRTQVERSMAQNGFSSSAISASIGVSTPYVGVNASATKTNESQDSKNKGDFKDDLEYTASYNFPRARIFLDDLNLEVTKECAEHLVKIQQASNAIKANIDARKQPDTDGAVSTATRLVAQFFARFGHVFACTVQLGGQLIATKSASSIAVKEESQKRDAMQMAAAMSVEAKAASVGASASKGTSVEVGTANSNVNNTSTLAWSARGGNTLLCANPPAWANSVAESKLWRVMEQDNIELLPDLIARLTRPVSEDSLAWPGIAEVFLNIAQNNFQRIPPVQPGTWTGKIRFETADRRKVVFKNGELCVSDSGEEAIFQVLDAEMRRRAETLPTMPQLYADWPLFMVSGSPARQSQEAGGQFPGLHVANDGKIKRDGDAICRWSLRPASELPSANAAVKSRWTPSAGVKLRDGDEVGLFCHSYHAGGSYITTTDPPWFAPYAVQKPGEDALRVWKLDQFWLSFMRDNKHNNHANWAFMNSGRANMQSLLERSDRGERIEADNVQVQAYRRVFGPATLQEWTADHEHLTSMFASNLFKQLGFADRLIDARAVGQGKWDDTRRGMERTLSDFLSTGVGDAMKRLEMSKLEPLRLRVKFVN